MIIASTKRAQGDTSGFGFGECSTSGERSAPTKIKTAPIQSSQTVDGVYHEPPKAAPKKQYWTTVGGCYLPISPANSSVNK